MTEPAFLKRAQEAGLEIIDGKSMLACQQIAMMKFHFDCDLSAGMLPEIEEIVDVAVAKRGNGVCPIGYLYHRKSYDGKLEIRGLRRQKLNGYEIRKRMRERI